MARPRKITDEQLLDAAGRVIARLGPGFTLADVAGQAGVTPGTLVHRFGSKHALLVAMFEQAIAAARRTPPEPAVGRGLVAAVADAVIERYAPLDDAALAANHLAQLAFDLADDELRERLAQLHAALEAGLEPLLRRAVEAGGLPGAPPVPIAARILAALADGTAIRWSTNPHGQLRTRLHTDLDAVLVGWSRPPHF